MRLIEADNIFIIAGGPSAKGLDFSKIKGRGYIMGVNDSAIHTPCDGVFTMDGLWLKNRWWSIRQMKIDAFARITAFRKHVGLENAWDRLCLYNWEIDKPGMSDSDTCLWGNNSGDVTLNYAYLCKPKRVFLFGFDLTVNSQEHWYPQYPWRGKVYNDNHFRKWLYAHNARAEQFKNAGIEVYNVSKISKIGAYNKINYKEALEKIL
jgi:hypothetical protein